MSERVVKANFKETTGVDPAGAAAPADMAGALAKQGVARLQQSYQRMATAAEQINEAWRENYLLSADRLSGHALKVIADSRANTVAALDFMNRLLGTRSFADVISLSAAHARMIFEAASAQNKEFWQLGQSLAEAGEQTRQRLAGVMNKAS